MADGSIVLPPQTSTIQPNEGRMSENLDPPSLRQSIWEQLVPGNGLDSPVVVQVQEESDGTITQVGSDGSVALGLPNPAVHSRRELDPESFGENLAERGEANLGAIGEEVIQGVQADITSRSEWVNHYIKSVDLLGLKLEDVQHSGSGKDVSRANETLLLEAIINCHAATEAEMLPAAGPTKVTTIGRQSDEEEERAKDFQDSINYFLTEKAPEYYPDTSRMLMGKAFCGNGFKKIYRCPLRRRPVSESVHAIDLIVSEQATDLDNALRVTHQIEMSRAQLKRMQIVGKYRSVDLGPPTGNFTASDQAQRKIKEVEGLLAASMRPQDMPYQVWEVDVDLDLDDTGLSGMGFERDAPEGLPLPYKVTVESTSRQVLGISRNWVNGDDLFRKRNMYVKFGLVPGLGFYDWGFMHLLGNQTRNLRSMLRLQIAAGMFSNFPGGIKAKQARTATNELAPNPGEWLDLDIVVGPNFDITKYLMPMPYKGPDPVFVQMREAIKSDAKRLAASTMVEVGEGRANVPVGTILAQIENQIQVMAGVHKRDHLSQKMELRKIVDLFAEYPDDLALLTRDRPISSNITSPHAWVLADEFKDLNLQPASDPNVPSQAHRIMLANVRVMLAQQFPGIFDVFEVARAALRAMGDDAERYVLRTPPDQQPDPKADAKQAEIAQKDRAAQMQAEIAGAKIDVQKQQIQAGLVQAAGDQATRQQVESTKASAVSAAPGAPASADMGPAKLAMEDRHHAVDTQVEAAKIALEREKIAAGLQGDLAKSQPPPAVVVPGGGG